MRAGLILVPLDLRMSSEAVEGIVARVGRPAPDPGHRPRCARSARGRPRPIPDDDGRRDRRPARRPPSRPTGRRSSAAWPRPTPDDVFELVFTSGTTGTPKGVMLAHANVVASIETFHRIVPPMEHRIVSLLPLSHLLEQAVGLFYALSVGADILYVRSRNPRVIFDALRDHRVTSMVVVPAGPRPVLERHRARGRQARPDDRLRPAARDRPTPADGLAAPPVRQHPQAARWPLPAVPVGRGLPATGPPAGLGGPRRDRPPGLRRDRDRDRQQHAPRTTTAWARWARRPTASRCASPTAARSSSAARPSSAATGRTRPRPPRRSPTTAGTRPATSAISMPRAASSCPAGSRTSSSCPTASTCIRRTSRTPCASPGSATRSCSRRSPAGSRRSSSARRPVGPRTDRRAGPGRGARPDRRRGQGRQRDAGPEPADRRLAAVARGGLPTDPHAQDQARPGPRLDRRRYAVARRLRPTADA